MTDHPSLADQAVAAVAAVGAMKQDITNEEPHRHAIRELHSLAEQTLANAFREVRYLTMLADTIGELGHRLKELTE